MTENKYYVYVYIDPRNFEEFYYGKGKGSRRFSHLLDKSDNPKAIRIRDIHDAKQLPIIRTVAAGLTEAEAHLIETTLIWKLGNGLTNQAAGRFVSLFRPKDMMHREIPRFDFQNGIFNFNVGEGRHRNWEDCRRLGFISAGQGPKWRDQILDFSEGDLVIAYLKQHGFVGVGRVLARAVPYRDCHHEGQLLHEHNLVAPQMQDNSEDLDRCEYVARVKWLASVPREAAKWKRKAGLYTTRLVKATLERQPVTFSFIETEFNINLRARAA